MTTTSLLSTSTINQSEIALITGLDRRNIPMDIIPIFLAYVGDIRYTKQDLHDHYDTFYHIHYEIPCMTRSLDIDGVMIRVKDCGNIEERFIISINY